MNFKRRLIEEFFIIQARILKFIDLIKVRKLATDVKFQFNFSKIMPARPKKHRDM